MNYNKKLQQLYRRKNNLNSFDNVSFPAKIEAQSNDALRYILATMESVDDNYRDNTIEAANKVYEHLKEFNCDFKLQGSVPTKTEIKQNSDIDLVVITKIAHILEKGLTNNYPYNGDLTQDLKQLREDCEKKLKSIYNKVVTTNAKSIEVYLTNPKRKVDVVVANWYETYKYHNSLDEFFKGIYLYDKENNKRIGPDFPFLRTHNIDNHSSANSIKKVVRFLKNIREDFEINGLDSFQINCIAYNLPFDYYSSNKELDLLTKLKEFLPNSEGHKKIKSPCDKEIIKIHHNPKLEQVLTQLIDDANRQNNYESVIY